ncbi:MAG: GNAT family N-acetyltransferase [Thermoplasmata archaeon]|nr:GNAT family N-acetyltransferase [Thermoplasmata archaeon]
MKLLRSDMEFQYYKLDDASDINKFIIQTPESTGMPNQGFSFFKGMGVTDYVRTFKMWLREFPRPIFIVAAKNKIVVGWVYIEEWGVPALDGAPVSVLRAIEVLPSMRHRKLGMKLVLLALTQIVGYLLVKPLTPQAEIFFRKIGFKAPAEFRKVPVDLTQHYGYLILPPFMRKKILEDIDNYFRTKTPHFT